MCAICCGEGCNSNKPICITDLFGRWQWRRSGRFIYICCWCTGCCCRPTICGLVSSIPVISASCSTCVKILNSTPFQELSFTTTFCHSPFLSMHWWNQMFCHDPCWTINYCFTKSVNIVGGEGCIPNGRTAPITKISKHQHNLSLHMLSMIAEWQSTELLFTDI